MSVPESAQSLLLHDHPGGAEPLATVPLLKLGPQLHHVQGLGYEPRGHTRHTASYELLVGRQGIVFLITNHIFLHMVVMLHVFYVSFLLGMPRITRNFYVLTVNDD